MSTTTIATPQPVATDDVAPTSGYGNLSEKQAQISYDVNKPSKDDLILYKGTCWTYVPEIGWVNQGSGPDDKTLVRGFGNRVEVKYTYYEVRNGLFGDVSSKGYGYGPVNDEEGVYKIESSCVVAYWHNGEHIWYGVKWDNNNKKFTKGARAAPEGHPGKGDKVIKWLDSLKLTVESVDLVHEFYHDDKWWVKQGGQLVEQEWNERSNQFEAKNRDIRGPRGKLVVGRFGKLIKKSELGFGVYQNPNTGEVDLARGTGSFIDEQTGVVYHCSINGVSHTYWWYANWDGGIGNFGGTWWISSGPGENIREWERSTNGPFDLDAAKDGQIVWYCKSFWKKISGVWKTHAWDGKNSKFVIKEETTVPPGALIAPVLVDRTVKVVENMNYSIPAPGDKTILGVGAWKMDDGEHCGNVFWWDGKMWSVPNWSKSGQFGPGTKKVEPKSELVKKLNHEKKFDSVSYGEEFLYMGSLWRKDHGELILCGGIQGMFEKGDLGKRRVPIGGSKPDKVGSRW